MSEHTRSSHRQPTASWAAAMGGRLLGGRPACLLPVLLGMGRPGGPRLDPTLMLMVGVSIHLKFGVSREAIAKPPPGLASALLVTPLLAAAAGSAAPRQVPAPGL